MNRIQRIKSDADHLVNQLEAVDVGINAFMGGRETTDSEYIVQLPGDALMIAAPPFF